MTIRFREDTDGHIWLDLTTYTEGDVAEDLVARLRKALEALGLRSHVYEHHAEVPRDYILPGEIVGFLEGLVDLEEDYPAPPPGETEQRS